MIINNINIDNIMFVSNDLWCVGQQPSKFLESNTWDSLVFSPVGPGVEVFLLFFFFRCSDVDVSLKSLSHVLHWGWAQKTGPTCRRGSQLHVSPSQIYVFSCSRAWCSVSLNVLNHCKLSALMVISLNSVLRRWRVFFFFSFFCLCKETQKCNSAEGAADIEHAPDWRLDSL